MMAPKKPRYEARFRNGRWTVFDYWSYRAISTHSRETDALRAAAEANRVEVKR